MRQGAARCGCGYGYGYGYGYRHGSYIRLVRVALLECLLRAALALRFGQASVLPVLALLGAPVGGGRGGGAGLAVYEVVPAGQELTISVKVPTTGGNMPTARGWVDFFADIAENPMRSISPARGRATGRMTLMAVRQIMARPKRIEIEKVTPGYGLES